PQGLIPPASAADRGSCGGWARNPATSQPHARDRFTRRRRPAPWHFSCPTSRHQRSMKKEREIMSLIKSSSVLAAVFVGLFAGSARAQEEIDVKVPFSFVVH